MLSTVGEPFQLNRLRVLRGSAGDPLNLLQVMLAKGFFLASFPAVRSGICNLEFEIKV
jgi:hypothetical protein